MNIRKYKIALSFLGRSNLFQLLKLVSLSFKSEKDVKILNRYFDWMLWVITTTTI